MYKAIVGFLLFWCKISGCKLEGLENLPKTGAVVTMANHVHVFDPLLLALRRSFWAKFSVRWVLFL